MAGRPETKYASLGHDRIAYQVWGQGAVDVLFVAAAGEPVDVRWDWPAYAAFLNRLGSKSRWISFDRRGNGASDPMPTAVGSWEGWAEDARAVLDAVGSERAIIFGAADSGPTATLFAAAHPDRTAGLILLTTTARFRADVDYPHGLPDDVLDSTVPMLAQIWGTEAMADFGTPDGAADPAYRQWFARSCRASMSPTVAANYFRVIQLIDVRPVLSSIKVPALVMHRANNPWFNVDTGRFLADHIDGARFVIVPGSDGTVFGAPNAEILEEIEGFLARMQPAPEPNRSLAAILFTDIVESTERAAALGDGQWRDLLQSHDAVSKTLIGQHQGRLVKTTGDGVLAVFDGPGRAIRCATALRDALRPLGIEIRAGLHTGEVEMTGADIAGIGVHVAARVCDQASPGELLVSGVVPVLVAGSGIEFGDRGEYQLKGVPGTWKLFAVTE